MELDSTGGVVVKSLASKLADVMGAVERIPKRGKNAFHGYDYATEADIVEVVRKEMSDRNVILVPQVDELKAVELPPNKKGEPRDPLCILHMTFTFMDGDSDERIEKRWVGVGQDGGDKGAYKAMTGAEKYFLLKTFLIPTGDDPERDSKDEAREVKQRDKATAKPDAKTKKARPPLPAGAVYIEKVVPKERGGTEYAELVLSTGEVLYARDRGCISLAMNLANEGAPTVVTTHRNGKGNVEIDELSRWKPDLPDVGPIPRPATTPEAVDLSQVPF